MYRCPSRDTHTSAVDVSPGRLPLAARAAALCIALALTSAAAACAAAPGGAGGAPTPPGSAREDRVVLTAFDVVRAVTASRHTVFVASTDGVAALDRDFGRWLPPLAFERGFGIFQSTAMAADPVDEGVWIASGGIVLYYRPSTGDIVRGVVPGTVYDIYFDKRDPSAGAYLRGSAGWALADRTGMVSPVDPARVPPNTALTGPPTLRTVYAAYPSLRGAAPLLTRDADLRSWPVISGTASPDRAEVWLGTAGGGLYRVDPLFLKGEQLPFGLLETATGALARDSAGVWMAGSATAGGSRAGLTYASKDLQQWRWLASPAVSRVLSEARAYAMSIRGGRLWVGTDRGVVALDAGDPDRALSWSATSGLASDRVLAVAASDSGAWAGTERGLAYVASAGSERAARSSDVHAMHSPDMGVLSLLLRGDTLWVASTFGLFLVRGASPDSLPRRVNIQDARLIRPVLALAGSDSLVAAATDRDLLVLNPATASLIPRFDAVNIAPISPVTAMAMDANTIWLTGPGGVLVVSRSSGASRLLPAPGPIPAQAMDVVLDPDFAWIATPEGVVRLRRASDGGVR